MAEQSRHSSFKKQRPPSRDYLDGLEDYWAGRPRTAIEHLTKVLADQPDHEDRMPLYRLWIEVLADEYDHDALRSLATHLTSRSDADPEDRESYFCLRGIVALELDEFQAAELMATAVSKSTNPYAQELRTRISFRRGSEAQESGLFVFEARVVADYFHVRMVATNSYFACKNTELKKIMALVKKQFSGSPISEEITLFEALENKDYQKAYQSACILRSTFPVHPHYGVYAAYAATKIGMITEAIDLLQKAVLVCGENDPDITSMLGYCYDVLYQATNDQHHKDRCFYFLSRAQILLEKNGFGSAHLNAIAHSLASDIRSKEGYDRPKNNPSAWVIKLSARHFHELKTSSEDEVRTLTRSIGDDPKPGDVVFFVADDYAKLNEGGWRIGAIYSVESDPKWSLLNGKESVLRLVSRPEVSIPISISAVDSDRRKNHRKASQALALDDAGFAKITDAIEEYQNFDGALDQVLGDFSRLRGTS